VVQASAAPDGLVVSRGGGALPQIRDNASHGVMLGDGLNQTGAIDATIAGARIHDNQIGIRVEQSGFRTANAIVANNIYNNRDGGIVMRTSDQKVLGDGRTFNSNDVHHNAVTGMCTATSGAVQTASQIVFDGPIATFDPAPDPDTGPDPTTYPDDHRCYWGVGGDAPISSHSDCNLMNSPTLAPDISGGVVNRCIWNGWQCRISWWMSQEHGPSQCSSARNRVFNYINNLAVGSALTQRGVAAINGAYVNARRNLWGAGGAPDATATDATSGSKIVADNACTGIETSCVY
jgi:hypothetical protein